MVDQVNKYKANFIIICQGDPNCFFNWLKKLKFCMLDDGNIVDDCK